MKLSRLLLFPALLLSVTIHAQDRYYQTRSLEGIKSVDVAAWPINDNLKDSTVAEMSRARLKAKGLPVVFSGGEASLAITILPSFDQRLKVWLVVVRLELKQRGILRRTGESHAATTWERTGCVSDSQDLMEARKMLGQFLDEFAEDFRRANP
ncbi:MAG TPA: hypothetical protein VKB86_03460 [Pyrinomonadaceae bacterium]|nr:hypothetical protein [Pyrinomonadaceae bacterium]